MLFVGNTIFQYKLIVLTSRENVVALFPTSESKKNINRK